MVILTKIDTPCPLRARQSTITLAAQISHFNFKSPHAIVFFRRKNNAGKEYLQNWLIEAEKWISQFTFGDLYL